MSKIRNTFFLEDNDEHIHQYHELQHKEQEHHLYY